MCKVLLWLSLALTSGVHYHTVVMAVDRAVAILVPFWHRTLNKSVTARRVSSITSVGSFIASLVVIPYSEWNATIAKCSYKPNSPPFYILIYILVVVSLFPIVVIIISNIVFAWALIKRPPRARGTANTEAARVREMERRRNNANYVIMMLVTTCSFVILQLVGFVLDVEAARRIEMQLEDGSVEFFRALARVPIILNSSLNIVFYSSTSMFRKALRGTLKSMTSSSASNTHQ